MNPIFLIWDTLYTSTAITDKNASRKMIDSMGEFVGDTVKDVMNWNTVRKGQKTTGRGYSSGLRFIIDVSDRTADSIVSLSNRLLSFENELCATSTVLIAEELPIPMDIPTRERFPDSGRLLLSVRFTHGLGYDDDKSIKNAITTQTKETKDALNPIGTGKGSSGARFSEEFHSILSDPYWFLTFPVGGSDWSSMNVNSASDGGAYQLNFDLHDGAKKLTQASKDIWWEDLDPDEITISPTLIVDCSEAISNQFDPANFHHLINSDASNKLIEKVLSMEEKQNPGDTDMHDELSYKLGRITRGRRIPRQLGDEHGLVHGFEESIVMRKFILPWISEEFINCLGFFLMTRKPNHWRNGKSDIFLLHEFSEEIIESLKGEN